MRFFEITNAKRLAVHVRAKRDNSRRNASGETGSIPVPPVEHLAVEQHDVFVLSVGADVGDKIIEIGTFDQREHIGEGMKVERRLRINLNGRCADRRPRLRQSNEASPMARLAECGSNLALALSGRLQAKGLGDKCGLVVWRNGASPAHGAPWWRSSQPFLLRPAKYWRIVWRG